MILRIKRRISEQNIQSAWGLWRAWSWLFFEEKR